MPCVASGTVSLSGNRVALIRFRRSVSSTSGTFTCNGRMVVVSPPFGCATAFMAVLLGDKRKLERPSGLAAAAVTAAPQRRRRLWEGTSFIANSLGKDSPRERNQIRPRRIVSIALRFMARPGGFGLRAQRDFAPQTQHLLVEPRKGAATRKYEPTMRVEVNAKVVRRRAYPQAVNAVELPKRWFRCASAR